MQVGRLIRSVLVLSRQTIGLVAIASSALVLGANCVGLDKPSSVAACAALGTCSDDINGHSDAGQDGKDGTNADSRPIADLRPEASAADEASAFDTRTMDDVIDDANANELGSVTSDTRDTVGDPSALGDAPGDPSLPGDTRPEAAPEAMPESGPESRLETGPEAGPEAPAEPGRDGGDTGTGNCINHIINSGYVYGSVPPCSACKDNSTPLQTKCEGMLDCLAPPSTKADLTYCQNKVSASQRVYECVTALTDAACPSGF
jgi:hypothetical protein